MNNHPANVNKFLLRFLDYPLGRFSLVAMHPVPDTDNSRPASLASGASSRLIQEFRLLFTRSLSQCVGKGFTVEEVFGVIWEETLDQIRLHDSEQMVVYHELIQWARNLDPMVCLQFMDISHSQDSACLSMGG